MKRVIRMDERPQGIAPTISCKARNEPSYIVGAIPCGRSLVCCIFLVFFTFFTSLFFLFPHRVVAIGETTVVQINGPAQPPGFSPALLTIHMYDTVIFINYAATPYAVSSTDDSFSSPAIPTGQRWRVTFGSLGAHEYHATAAPQHMIGEILVVADGVSLLPAPLPQVEATVITMIKAGKHPPDVIVLPTTSTPIVKHIKNAPTINTLLSPPILLMGGGVLLLLMLVLLSVTLYRRRVRRTREEEEMDTLIGEIVPKPAPQKQLVAPVEIPAKKRRPLLAGFHWKRVHDDDDDDDE